MSDTTIVHHDQEILVAIGTARSRAVLGVRGMMMRDIVGELSRRDLPACTMTVFVAGMPTAPGLYVWSGSITGVEGWQRYGWPVNAWEDGAWRPAVLADLPRFSLPPILPRAKGAVPC